MGRQRPLRLRLIAALRHFSALARDRLHASESLVRIVDGEHEVARHDRCYDRARQIETTEHLEALADQKRHARELRGRDRLRCACASAPAFLQAVALRGGHLGGTTARLLQLLDRYGNDALDAALHDALARGAVSAGSVAHLLDQQRRAQGSPPPLDTVLPDDPRVRDLHVTPHPLAAYDALAKRRAADDKQGGSHDR